MSIKDQMKANQKTIADLTASLSLWMGVPVKKEVTAKVNEIQDRALHRLMELEVTGQQVKIASMTEALALLKGEKTV